MPHVLLAVESCLHHEYRNQIIRETWGKDLDLVFFNGPMLHCPDDYQNLCLKTQAICRWAVSHDYDFLCKIDTDTYVHITRLMASGFEHYDYSGYIRPDFEPAYCYGPCYWLSRRAFTIVANTNWHGDPYEDLMVGSLLHDAGIFPHHDNRYSHWFAVSPDNDKIIHHLNSMPGKYSEEAMRDSHANGK